MNMTPTTKVSNDFADILILVNTRETHLGLVLTLGLHDLFKKIQSNLILIKRFELQFFTCSMFVW